MTPVETINAGPYNMSIFGEGYAELVPGEICEDAVAVFTMGQCHALALALHEATGWQIVGCDDDEWDPERGPKHFAVRHPSGRLLDIAGLSEASGGLAYARDVTPEYCREMPDRGYYDADMAAAREFVPAVLALPGVAL